MWEFTKCDMTNTKWANAFKIKSKSANRLARLRIATNVQFAKTIVSAKWNKGKCKKTRGTGTFDAFFIGMIIGSHTIMRNGEGQACRTSCVVFPMLTSCKTIILQKEY